MFNYEFNNAEQVHSERDPFTLERYKQFYRHLPESVEKILDVGCNTGRGGKTLKGLDPKLRIIGLDCVQSRLDALPAEAYIDSLCCYSTEIRLEDNSVDAIVAGEFIEHLLPEDVQKTLNEFFRVLKQGGVLLMTTPNPQYIRLKLTGKTVLSKAHLSEHCPMEMTNRLEQIGFDNVMVRGSGRMTRVLGEGWPILSFYGSYLARAEKNV